MTLPGSDLEAAATSADGTGLETSAETAIAGRSLWSIAWRSLRKDKVAMAGGVVVVLLILIAAFSTQLTHLYGHSPYSHNPDLTDINTQYPIGALGGVSGSHWLGVEPVFGQDVFANLIWGLRTSLVVGLLSTLLTLILGVPLGIIAGYYRGWVDSVLARSMDTFLSFPTLLFSIALLGVFEQTNSFLGLSGINLKFAVIIFVLGFFSWPYIARIVRGQVLSLREKEFVDAARSLGASNFRIISVEILPNLVGPILVFATLSVPSNILGEAGLSFLGVGIPAPQPSLGQMISTAANGLQLDPAFLFWPGLTIFLTVLAFNLFGDGLRDALDPKSTR